MINGAARQGRAGLTAPSSAAGVGSRASGPAQSIREFAWMKRLERVEQARLEPLSQAEKWGSAL